MSYPKKAIYVVTITLLLLATINCLSYGIGDALVQLPADVSASARDAFMAGVSFIHENNYSEAAAKFEITCKEAPDFAAAHSNYGLCLLKLGKLQQASDELTKAYAIDPKMPMILVNLASAKQLLGQVDEGAGYLQDYLKLYPKGEYAVVVKDMLSMAEAEIARRKGATTSEGKEDYLSEVTTHGIVRWNEMPIAVFIESGQGVEGFSELFPATLKQALNQWAEASDGKITFAFVDKKEDADLLCKWTDNPNDLANAMEGGEASVSKYENGTISKGHITILTKGQKERISTQKESLLCICLHEVGHALGLQHSSQNGDVMFAFMGGTSIDNLSDRDKKTIQKLYAMSLPKMGSAVANDGDATHNLSPKIIPPRKLNAEGLQLYNDGVTLLKANNYAEAVVKFEEVCKQTPDFAEAHANFGFCLMKLNKLPQSADELAKAYAIKPTLPVVLLNLASVNQLQGNFQKAISYYQQFLGVYPSGEKADEVKAIVAQLQNQITHQ